VYAAAVIVCAIGVAAVHGLEAAAGAIEGRQARR